MSHIVLVPQKGEPSIQSDSTREFWERHNAQLRGATSDNKMKIIDCSSYEEAEDVLNEILSKGKAKFKPVPKAKGNKKGEEEKNQ